MDLYRDILLHLLSNQKTSVEVTFPQLKVSAVDLVESASYCTLVQIQKILQDDSLSDEACFFKIEKIVRQFERLGSSCGSRHDFR